MRLLYYASTFKFLFMLYNHSTILCNMQNSLKDYIYTEVYGKLTVNFEVDGTSDVKNKLNWLDYRLS